MAASRQRSAEERLERLYRFHALLSDVSRRLAPGHDLPSVLEVLLREMRGLLDFEGGSILLLEGGQLRVATADPELRAENARILAPGEGPAGQVAVSGSTLYARDVSRDGGVLLGLRPDAHVRSFLAVPLVCLGDLVGVLQIYSDEPDAFTDDDVRLLEGLGAHVASAVETARRTELVVELEQAKSDFIARVSHELRTPLAIVQGFLETLVVHGARLSEEDRLDALQRTRNASQRLGDLVEELLAVASQQAGVLRPAPRTLDLVAELEAARRRSGQAERITLAAPAGVTVFSDGETIQRIVEQLLDNALTYAGSAEIVVEQTARETRVLVRDDGPGVPDRLGERIFERFVRGTDEPHGLGLGLSLARSLASTVGARLELVRDARDGATFALVLPHEEAR